MRTRPYFIIPIILLLVAACMPQSMINPVKRAYSDSGSEEIFTAPEGTEENAKAPNALSGLQPVSEEEK